VLSQHLELGLLKALAPNHVKTMQSGEVKLGILNALKGVKLSAFWAQGTLSTFWFELCVHIKKSED
jgi:hypothetical protein